jgi:hypothetical protein
MDIVELDATEPGPEPGSRPGAGPRLSGRGRLGLILVVVAALAGAFVLLGRTPAADEAPTPVPSTAPAFLKPPPGPGQRQYLAVTAICGVATDRRTTMAITFEVSNVSRYDVTIDAVRSVLPLPGLRPQPATAGGSCPKPGRQPVAGPIRAGRLRYFTLHFGLPKTCPAPNPVFVRITFHAAGFAESNYSILEPDLAVPEFDACPVTTTLPQPKISG